MADTLYQICRADMPYYFFTGFGSNVTGTAYPRFSKKGKVMRDMKEVRDVIEQYALLDSEVRSQQSNLSLPKIKLVAFESSQRASTDVELPDMTSARVFLKNADVHTWSSVGRFVRKLTEEKVAFKYLLHIEGSHQINVATVKIKRNARARQWSVSGSNSIGETVVALDSTTSLIYLKMKYDLLGAWDNEGKQIVFSEE